MRRVSKFVLLAALATGVAHAQGVAPQPVEETSLYRTAFETGLLDQQSGGLADDLWRDADAEDIDFLLTMLDAHPVSPSMGAAMRRVLLSGGAGPVGLSPAAGGRKLLALAEAGFTDEARTVASLSNAPSNDPWVGQALAVADLVDGDVAAACQRNRALSSGRDAPFWVKLRILCYAAAGEYDAADLTLGIVREQGLLSDNENALLTAISIPAPLKTPLSPNSALEYAALKAADGAIDAAGLASANAGVARAIARDAKAEPRLRVIAAIRAVGAGAMTGAELRALYDGLEFSPEEIGSAETARPEDPLTDALLYRSARTMAAPEFLRDRAKRVAAALGGATNFDRAYAAALVFEPALRTFEGAVVTPDEAGSFASAYLALGDAPRATNWLMAMLGGGMSTLNEAQALRFIELASLLAVLDPASGGAVAASANIELETAPRPALSSAVAIDRERLARIVGAAFHASATGSKGQAGLAALALAGAADAGDPVAETVLDASLRVAGLETLARRRAFEAAVASRFEAAPVASPIPATPAVEKVAPPADEQAIAPRLKPKPR